ncbi:MAG TPA: N-acetylmuramoyl-L-alanine amidase [Pseudomonadales bacterium]|nr:N-acetylmuramoyl-L-alanine amidase [Pseudomonadales bacterium]
MKVRLRHLADRLAVCFALLVVVSPVYAATIDAVAVQPDSGNTRVVFDVSARVRFQVFTLENPHRVVVDLDDARPRSGVNVGDTRVSGNDVAGIRGGPRDDAGYRIVIDVADRLQPNAYMIASPTSRGDRLIVELRAGSPGATASRPTPAKAVPPAPSPVPVAAAPAAAKTKAGRSEASTAEGPLRDFIVAIDAGHGGQDPGAIGVGKIQEKRIALAIAKELERLFNSASGYRGALTRKGDYYLTLRQRTTVARNQRADLFVSIHADAFSGPDARGASVYTLSAKGATSETARWLAEKENASDLIGGAGDVSLDDKDALLAHVLLDLSMDGNRSASIEAGSAVLDALNDFTQLHRNHVEQAGFVVLKSPDIPSILVETGYLSNATEARSLSQVAYQRKVAQAIFKGVTAYAQRHAPPGTTLAWRQQKRSPPS